MLKDIKNICKKSDLVYILALSFILWLVMFPEFSLTADNCRVIDENGEVCETDMTDRELAIAVMEADSDRIVIRSRFLEMVKEWSEGAHAEESKSTDNGTSETGE